MAAGLYSFTVEQGATFQRFFNYLDANGTPLDLSDFHARMHFRDSFTATTCHISLSSSAACISAGKALEIVPASGSSISSSIYMCISAANTTTLNFDKTKYDLEIEDSTGFVRRIVQGNVKLSKEVTK